MSRKILVLCSLAFVIASIVLLNLYTIPYGDELSGAYRLLSTPSEGPCPRILTLSGLVNAVYEEYFHGSNGRSILAFVCCSVAVFKLYFVYRLVNAFMFFVLTYLVLKEGGVSRIGVRQLCFGALLVFLFQWYATCFNAGAHIGIAYLWMDVAAVVVMRAWMRGAGWWLPVVAFIFGWGQEGFSLPMTCALFLTSACLCFHQRRFALTKYQVVSLITMLMGNAMLCLSPAVRNRGASFFCGSIGVLLLGFVHNVASLVVSFWPFVLLMLVAWIIWRKRAALLNIDGLEWLFFGGTALGMLILLGQTPGVGPEHLSLPVTTASLIVVLRHRVMFRLLWNRLNKIVLPLSFGLLISAATLQVISGRDLLRALSLYDCDEQGISYRRLMISSPMAYAYDTASMSRWHRSFYRRERQHQKSPAFLTPYLYQTLYCRSNRFFAEARPLSNTKNLFVTERAPHCVVQVGSAALSAEESRIVSDYLDKAYSKPRGLARLVPGRFRLWFPAEDFLLGLPQNVFSFVAQDGQKMTLHTRQ